MAHAFGSSLPADPFGLLGRWMGVARRREGRDSSAMALATADAEGRPNVRIVLLKQVDERGFVFYTSHESVKAREIEARPEGSLALHWSRLGRQVRAFGVLERVSREETEVYFASRRRESRLAAWASRQSRRLVSRERLEEAFAKQKARFAGRDVPAPSFWGGYRLLPLRVEFWVSRPARLHDRLVFERSGVGARWKRARLFP